MSDVEGDVAPVVEQTGPMSLETALQEVLKTAAIHDGVAKGLNEAVRALDKRQAHLCLLAKTCDHAEYIRLIEALCTEHNISLLKVDDGKKLGNLLFYLVCRKLSFYLKEGSLNGFLVFFRFYFYLNFILQNKFSLLNDYY